MSLDNPLTPMNLLAIADRLESYRGPRLVESWRRQAAAGEPLPAWRMRRQLCEAFRDEWRAAMDDRQSRRGRSTAAMKTVVSAFRQLARDMDAALLAVDPDAMPKVAADTIRRRVNR